MTESRSNITIDDFSEEELVRHSGDSGYMYPFTNTQEFSEVIPAPWEGTLGESYRGENGIYVKPGFNLQEAVSTIQGPALEVGGPTPQGYAMLEGIELPGKPIITNLRGNNKLKSYEEYQHSLKNGDVSPQKWGASSLTTLDKLVLDGLFDATKLPIANGKVGILLSSCMEKVNIQDVQTAIVKLQAWDGQSQAKICDEFEDEQYVRRAEAIINNPDSALVRKPESPRLATIVEAARILQPGGLYISRGVSPTDIKVAQAVGLELVMHTPPENVRFAGQGDDLHVNINEAVFQKPPLPIDQK